MNTQHFTDDFLNAFYVYDAYQEVETAFGHRDEKVLGRIGMNLHMLNQNAKKEELALRDDTYFWCPWEDTLNVFIELGFQPVVLRTFIAQQTQIIYYHPHGIIATAEPELVHKRAKKRILTVTGRTMMFYNWVPNDVSLDPTETQEYLKYSHMTSQGVKLGALSLSEAFRHKLAMLEHYGRFLPQWQHYPMAMDLRNAKERHENKPMAETLDEIKSNLPSNVLDLMGKIPATI